MFPGGIHNHPGIFGHGLNFLGVSYDPLIAGQLFKYLGRNLLPVKGNEPLERFLKLRPFVFDHPPDETCLEDAPGDFRQVSVVTQSFQFAGLGHLGQPCANFALAAFLKNGLFVDAGKGHIGL